MTHRPSRPALVPLPVVSVGEALRWLRIPCPAPRARFQLVCFPHAGGSAAGFRSLAAALAPGVEVLSVQYPGRQDRRADPLPDSLVGLARRAAGAVLALGPRPRAFLGHSMGALVAYEAARSLGPEDGPALLVASGKGSPATHGGGDHHLLDDSALVRHVHSLGGTEGPVLDNPDLRALVLPAIRADYRLLDTYRYEEGPRLEAPVLALTGEDDPTTTVGEAALWSEHTLGGCSVRTFEGGHFFLGERTEEVAGAVSAALPETANP